MWAAGISSSTASVVRIAKLNNAAGTMLPGFGHARIIPARTTAIPRIAMLVPAVREAINSFCLTRRQTSVPLASIGVPPRVTRGARYIIDMAIGPER